MQQNWTRATGRRATNNLFIYEPDGRTFIPRPENSCGPISNAAYSVGIYLLIRRASDNSNIFANGSLESPIRDRSVFRFGNTGLLVDREILVRTTFSQIGRDEEGNPSCAHASGSFSVSQRRRFIQLGGRAFTESNRDTNIRKILNDFANLTKTNESDYDYLSTALKSARYIVAKENKDISSGEIDEPRGNCNAVFVSDRDFYRCTTETVGDILWLG